MSDAHALQMLRFVLRPIARFCLRHNLTVQSVNVLFKQVLIDSAAEMARAERGKVNALRISLRTGVYREDVAQHLREGSTHDEPLSTPLSEILTRWENDPKFCTKSGTPRVLSHEGANSDFERLVLSVRKGLYPPTVLDALETMGAVERSRTGLKLKRGGAVTAPQSAESYDLLAKDIETLLTVVEQNAARPDSIGDAHIRTEFDNISQAHLPEIRRWFVRHTRIFHRQARAFLSKFDADLHPRVAQKGPCGERVVLQSSSLSRPTPGK